MFPFFVSTDVSAGIDRRAADEFDLDEKTLVETAGSNCAQTFIKNYPEFFDAKTGGPKTNVTAAVGTGSNSVDALVMLLYLIRDGKLNSSSVNVVQSRYAKEKSLCAELLASLNEMGVASSLWDENKNDCEHLLKNADIIIDGIAGTGIKGSLTGASMEMVRYIYSLKAQKTNRPFVVSVDMPSGCGDDFSSGDAIIDADVTLSIEPQKYCIYHPWTRIYAGRIIPVGGVFPTALLDSVRGPELILWETAKQLIPPVKKDAYKYERGLVDIHAGAVGMTGAPVIAARGAQVSGAGLIRLFTDENIYPVIASAIGADFPGIMVYPVSERHCNPARESDAVLLGPGWGKDNNRKAVFNHYLANEKNGTPLILDADAVNLAKDTVFCGNCILTPHPGEFASLTGTDMGGIDPVPLLLKTAENINAVIILKGHVINIASPDGRRGIIDGMMPNLAMGGSGDLLAGICTAIAARMKKNAVFDAFNCAAAAASLFMEAGRQNEDELSFCDPLEVAEKAAKIAGRVWLLPSAYKEL